MTGYYITGTWLIVIAGLICWPSTYARIVTRGGGPAGPDEPEPPIDPEDLDQLPPADVDVCERCGGTGAIWPTNDPQDVVSCPACRGEGYLPEWSAA